MLIGTICSTIRAPFADPPQSELDAYLVILATTSLSPSSRIG
jgi:hypothetical protein